MCKTQKYISFYLVEMRLTTKFLPKGAVSILLRYILNSSFLTGLVNLNLIYLPV